MRLVLLGDSHLARVQRALPQLGPDVLNVAVGGATCDDLDHQAHDVGLGTADVAVVSIGTNDAFPRRGVALTRFTTVLGGFLDAHAPGGWVLVSPPGLCVDLFGAPGDLGAELDAEVARRGDVATGLVRARGGVVVDTRAELAPLGRAAFADDGVHLTGAAYDVLLPVVADAAARVDQVGSP